MGVVRVGGRAVCRFVGRFVGAISTAFSPVKLLLGLGIFLFVSACGVGPDPRLLDVGNVDLSPKQPIRVGSDRGITSAPAGKGTYQVYPGDDPPPLKTADSTGKALAAGLLLAKVNMEAGRMDRNRPPATSV